MISLVFEFIEKLSCFKILVSLKTTSKKEAMMANNYNKLSEKIVVFRFLKKIV